ncbi:transcription factor bHLH51 [Senna tora]|uniref:Transcription factor bHLH51 n=1 Tax=Senna tora TaxID=362788 RepID=A0A834WR58_9FABA|nr:transcription factor bHLH51 [Senna tora]
MENYLHYCSSSSSDPPLFSPLLHHPHHVVSDSSCSLQFSHFPNPNSSWPLLNEERAASASKSHSQAEKRRRDRINAQLATLRKLIPKSDKVFYSIITLFNFFSSALGFGFGFQI